MAVTGCKQTFFLVWSPKGSILLTVAYNPEFWIELQEKLCNFFSSYMVPYLVGKKSITFCPACEDFVLEENEISIESDNSVLCECCDLWYHWRCCGIQSELKEDVWVCQACLQSATERDDI